MMMNVVARRPNLQLSHHLNFIIFVNIIRCRQIQPNNLAIVVSKIPLLRRWTENIGIIVYFCIFFFFILVIYPEMS